MKSAPNLLLEARHSRIEFALMCTIALLAIIGVAASGLPFIAATAAVTATVFALAWTLRQRRRRAPPRLQLQTDGLWRIESASMRDSASLVDARDLGFLIALCFETANRTRYALALWPDSVPADTRRRLRIWLNGAAATATDTNTH